jgi:predicted deacylase
MKSDYSEPEKEVIGKKIAEMLYLRKSQEEHGRFRTSWGTKTPVGIFETIRRLGDEIEAGTITATLIKNE